MAFDSADIQRLLQVVPPEAVLVGGQALAYWAQYFGVAVTSGPAISLDADFIGTGPTLVALASGMHGKAQWQSRRAISALIGCIAVPKDANQFLNIDVLKDLFGLDANKVAARSIAVDISERTVRIMHPIDVLESRVANFAGLKSKQDDGGANQVRLATAMIAHYIQSAMTDEKFAIKCLEHVFDVAKRHQKKRIFVDYGLDLFAPMDIIASLDFTTPHGRQFKEMRYPRLLDEMGKRRKPGPSLGHRP